MAKALSQQLKVIVQKINEKYARQIFENTAKEVASWMDSQTYYTNRTYNLTDSVGVGVYKKGVLVSWAGNPAKRASVANIIRYRGNMIHVDGRSLLNEAIRKGSSTYGAFADYTLVVFAEAPYAYWVDQSLGSGGNNKKGKGWWSEGLVPHIKSTFVKEFNKVFNNERI